jgi:hypothetical protein
MSTDLAPALHDQEQLAWRIQAMALAAEHMSLVEWEAKLRDRQADLEQREAEVASRLDEKYQQFQGLQEQLGQGREKSRRERDELARQRLVVESTRKKVQAEREKMGRDYLRLKRRFKKRALNQRKKWQQRQQQLEHLQTELEAQQAKIEIQEQQTKAVIDTENARLRQARQQLTEEQDRFCEQQEQAAQAHQIRAESLQQQERTLLEDEQRWQTAREELNQKCSELLAEAQGLENRIINARRQLPSAVPVLPRVDSTPPSVGTGGPGGTVAVTFVAPQEKNLPPTELISNTNHQHARALADSRLLLAEMYSRLAHTEEDRQARYLEAVAELEALAVQLQQQEDHLAERQRDLDGRADLLRQERDQMHRQQRELERQSSEWNVQQALWQAEKDRQQAAWQSRERLLHRREIALAELQRRQEERRRGEMASFKEVMQTCETAQQQWSKQAEEYRNRCRAVREAQQAQAEQALSLEHARAEFLDHVEDAASAPKRLERLRRRWESLSARPLREAGKHWQALETERQRWNATLSRFQKQLETQLQREQELSSREAENESFRRRVEQQAAEQEEAQAAWQADRARYEKQLAQLRNELERLAKELRGDGEPVTLPFTSEPLAA